MIPANTAGFVLCSPPGAGMIDSTFGRFRLDLARRELRRDQTPVRLGSRALDILCVLASAGGKVVSKTS